MAEQLVFDLPAHTALGRDDFFTSPANALAVEVIENWPQWPLNKLLLTGPEGAGKSHLAAIWADMAQARIIRATDLQDLPPQSLGDQALCVEDVEQIAGLPQAEAALFHLHNRAQSTGNALLMTGRGTPQGWGITLADLNSRIQGSNAVALLPPDDALLSAVLIKLFTDHQLRVEPELIAYLLPRMERSFAAARALVRALDRRALQDKRPIGVKMARQTLESLETETQ